MPRTYTIDSELLGQRIKLHDAGFGYLSAECADGVEYKASEIKIMQSASCDADPLIHTVKKLFAGTIVSARPLTPVELYMQRKAEEEKERLYDQ